MRFSLPLAVATAGFLLAVPAQAQWTAQRAPGGLHGLTDVFFTDADHGYASGSIGGLIKTDDGGQNWRSLRPGVQSSLRDVYFVTPDTGYVVGNIGVIIGTTDGGQNWTHHDLDNTGSAVNGVYFRDGRYGYVTQGDQIWHTADAGATWDTVYTYHGPLNIFTFRFLKFPTPLVGYAVGGYSGSAGNISQVVKTVDGGQTWTLLPSLAGGVPMGGAAAVAFPDALTGYVADVQNRLFRTTDGGQTWARVAQSATSVPYSMYFLDALTGYAVGDGGHLRQTTDGGQTWTDQALNGTDTYAAVFFPNRQSGYAVGSSQVDDAVVLHYTAPTGVPEPLSALGVSVYPNPATSVVRIANLPAKAAGEVALFALDGRRLAHVALPAGATAQLPTTGLAAGLYALRVTINGRPYQQKLVIE